MAWPSSSCRYLPPPHVIHGITRLLWSCLLWRSGAYSSLTYVLIRRRTLHMLVSTWFQRPSLGHTNWPTCFQVSNVLGVWHCSFTCFDQSPGNRAVALRFRHENAICLFDAYNGHFYAQIPGQENGYTRWNSVGILLPQHWSENMRNSRSHSWAPAFH